jgi:gamma-glutamyltranspeptidase/glutathione hydrolase
MKKIISKALFLFSFIFIVTSSCSTELPTDQSKKTTDIMPAAIASAHPLATDAGHEILKLGGNAFDAAVAVGAVLAVAEPYSSGLGGGGFWLLHTSKDNKDIMIDGREKAPIKAHRDLYLDENGDVIKKLSMQGPLAAGIPGVPAALVTIAKHYGRLPLATSLAPAIKIAREGYRIDDSYRTYAKLRLKALQDNHAAAHIFLNNNQVPPKDYVLKQPDLADTLDAIAKLGHEGFYSGAIAKQIVDSVQKAGGIWTLEDLSSYQTVSREPIQFNYHNVKITSASPPSSGGIVLGSIFRMLEDYDLSKLTSVQKKHLLIELMRRAYADRAVYLGDPDYVNIPTEYLIGKQNAQAWLKTLSLDKATASSDLTVALPAETKGTDTTHYSIIDNEGNRVAATLSINYPFGACFVAEGTGVLLNDEMDDFSAKPGIPNAYGLVGAEANAIASGKRPLSSMSPTFMESDDRLAIIGTPGGSRIISMVMLAILNTLDGLPVDQVVNAKRYHHQYLPDKVFYERGAFTDQEILDLTEMGHVLLEQSSPYGGPGSYGNMQMILHNKTSGTITAASDERGHGKSSVQ